MRDGMKWPWVSRECYDEVLRRAQVAEDRLYGAFKDGYTIPPRATVEQKSPEVLELLPAKLLDFVNNWESPEVRGELDREARKLIELGLGEDRIMDLWKRRSGQDTAAE